MLLHKLFGVQRLSCASAVVIGRGVCNNWCRVFRHELAVALSASADLDFIRKVGAKGGCYLTGLRWACLEDHQQRRRSAIDFVALVRHTARGRREIPNTRLFTTKIEVPGYIQQRRSARKVTSSQKGAFMPIKCQILDSSPSRPYHPRLMYRKSSPKELGISDAHISAAIDQISTL